MPPHSSFGFTKLVVHDLEKMVVFYKTVYGLHDVHRVTGESIAGEGIDEIMMSPDPAAQWSAFVLLQYVDRAPPPTGEVVLGFTTDDLPALCERITAAGGGITAPIRELPHLGVRVAFATDPEGHLAELVQVDA